MDKCTWSCNIAQFDDEMYETGCDESFEFTEGGIEENNFIYCPYCGKEIEETP